MSSPRFPHAPGASPAPRGSATFLGGVVLLGVASLGAFWVLGSSLPARAGVGLELAGGNMTVEDVTKDAFSRYGRNLAPYQTRGFHDGGALFRENWTPKAYGEDGSDGLGPLFNARSCGTCHYKNGRGRLPASSAEPMHGALVRLSVPGKGPRGEPLPEPRYGGQLQNHGVAGVPAEGRVRIRYEELPGTYADGTPYSLRKPTHRLEALAYGPLAEDVLTSVRVAPGVYGLGVVEALSDEVILARADADDRDGDGISGRPNWVFDIRSGHRRLGRFSWKAGQPSIEQQAATAFLEDMGITSELRPHENRTPAQREALAVPSGGSPELSAGKLAAVTHYLRLLAVPARRDTSDPRVVRGERLFEEAGCATCHVPTLVTGGAHPVEQLRRQTIHPYSDFLLHDMGEGLSDGRAEFEATGREWRTPPLWGIGLVETVNGHDHFLHDGRARGLAEAILWHAGEAEKSKEAFRRMPKPDREALLAFLRSL